MQRNGIAMATILALFIPTSTKAAEDLSSFGTPVATPEPTYSAAPISQDDKLWPAHVCAEIQRVEKVVISGARPSDRGMTRIGLLMLEQLHCGLNVSKKLGADQAILNEEKRKADKEYEENMAAAQRAAARPQEPIVVQVPQAAPQSSIPDPSPPLNCFTTRYGGGMSGTSCR